MPLCGNSIGTDRRFLAQYLPEIEDYLHYRSIDVSSVKELVRRWYPKVRQARPQKVGNHRALDDIRDSIEELRYYRERVFVPADRPVAEHRRRAGLMRAVVLDGYGGPEVLRVTEVDAPVPGTRRPPRRRPPRAPSTGPTCSSARAATPTPAGRRARSRSPGMEYAGRVAARRRPGHGLVGRRPVMGIETGGCYAEQVVTHARQALPVPDGVDLADAAAVPEVFITAWDALVVQGGLTSGRWALDPRRRVRRRHGRHPDRQGHRRRRRRHLLGRQDGRVPGARRRRRRRALAGRLAGRPPGRAGRSRPHDGVDTILDVVGGDEVDRNLQAVRPKGTHRAGRADGRGRAEVTIGLLLVKRARWIGTMLRGRPLEEKAAICRRFADEVLPLFTSGALRPVIDRRFPLDEVADAHRHMEADANVGKILVDVRPS